LTQLKAIRSPALPVMIEMVSPLAMPSLWRPFAPRPLASIR
jgi:hypothetical protein